MKPFSESWDGPLSWSSSGPFSREHHMRAGEKLVGELRFAGFARREASAECAEGRWTFSRGSRSGRRLTIADDRGGEVAHYTADWLGNGTLELPRGQSHLWRRFGLWRLTCGFTLENGEPLLVYRRKSFPVGRRGTLTIDADARRLPELSLLALFGWYLVLRKRKPAHG